VLNKIQFNKSNELKMKGLVLLIFVGLMLSSVKSYEQDNWSNVDFSKKYKANFKLKGKTVKQLKKHKTFVNNFEVKQAIVAKGSERSSVLQPGDPKAIYSDAGLVGIQKNAYQQMVNRLYNQFVKGLVDIGLEVTNGDEVLDLPYVKKQVAKGKKSTIVGNTGNDPGYEGKRKVGYDRIEGYGGEGAVKNDYSIPPQNVNRCITTNLIKSGFFYGKIANEGFNLLNVRYYVNFVSFNARSSYKSIGLETTPVISVNVVIDYYGPKDALQTFTYQKTIFSTNTSWIKNVRKVKDNSSDAAFFGFAPSFGYEIEADSDAYIAELESILTNLQKDIIKNLKNGLNK